jgi:hypothetical protein
VPGWNPHFRGDIEELGNIQHRATRLKKGGIYGKVKKVEINNSRN